MTSRELKRIVIAAFLCSTILIAAPQPVSAEWVTNPLTSVAIEVDGPGGRWVPQAAYMVRTTPMIADIANVRNVRVITLELVDGNSRAVFVKVYLGAGSKRSYLASFAMGEYMVNWQDWDRVVKLHKAVQGTARYRQLYGARDRRKQEAAAAQKRADDQRRRQEEQAKIAGNKQKISLTGIKSRYQSLGFQFVKPQLSYSATAAIDEIRRRPVLWEYTRTAQLNGTSREYMTFSVPNSEQDGEHPILAFLVLKQAGPTQFIPDYFIATRQGEESDYSVKYSIAQVKGAVSVGKHFTESEKAHLLAMQAQSQQSGENESPETSDANRSSDDTSDESSEEAAETALVFKPTWSLAELNFDGELASRQLAKRFLPIYPSDGLAAGEQAEVRLRAHVGVDGTIEQVEVVAPSGKPYFDAAAQDSVLKWRFEPIEQEPGTVQKGEIVIRFRLKESTRSQVQVDTP